MSLVQALCRLLDIDPNAPEEIETGYVSRQDLNSSKIVRVSPDGTCYSIYLDQLDEETEDDIFHVSESAAPKCSFCAKSVPVPEFVWHGRLYCGRCVRKRDVMLAELHPGLERQEFEVGICLVKNEKNPEKPFRFPFIWDNDILDDVRRARLKNDFVKFYDIEGGEIAVPANEIQAIKKPRSLIWRKWADPEYKRGA